MKTIGVLGGFGPQATMDFEERVHRVSQQTIAPNANSGYPPMVVYYCRHPPVQLAEDGTPCHPCRPDQRLLEAAKRLGGLSDFLVLTANGPHIFQTEIEQAAGRDVLSMIDVTVDEVMRRQWTRVGVLGFGNPVAYTRPLRRLGVECETAEDGSHPALQVAIFRLMEGRADAESVAVARSAVAMLRDRGVDGVILGCTELPFLLNADEGTGLINPIQLLAGAAVQAAMN